MRGSTGAAGGTPIDRRTMLKYMAVAGGMGVLASCRKNVVADRGEQSPTGARPPIGSEPDVLHVYEWAGYEAKWIWADYAAAGYADPKFSFLIGTPGAIAKTAAGYGWDVSHPETEYLQNYIDIGALQPWDTALISNFTDLTPVLENHGVVDGKQYEIVLDWGYAGVILNTDHVDPSINSYSYLFDDRYEGRISWIDEPDMLQIAGLVLGVESSIFDMSDEDLNAAKEYCIQKKKNLYSIWEDYNQMWDDVRQGNIWTAYAWQDAWVVLRKQAPVAYCRPKEGCLSWAEGLVLRADTKEYYHAHEFADAWAAPEVATRMINSWGYGHSNTSIDLSELDPEVVKVFGLDDPASALSEPASLFGRYMPNRDALNRAWDEVKAA